MFVLRDQIHIHAPIERCFLLSTSLAIVQKELGMQPVPGSQATRVSGLVLSGDRIHWKGWQLGLPQYHVSLISAFEPNRFFQDKMIAGRFKSFQHDHEFSEVDSGTLLSDKISFSLPFGPLGILVGRFVMVPHVRDLLHRRFRLLKRIAESDEWRAYLPNA